MAFPNIMYGVFEFVEEVIFRGLVQLPAAIIGNAHISAAAKIDTSKLRHRNAALYTTGSAVTAADATQPIHVVKAAGTVVGFRAGSVAIAVGDSTVTVDLKKNGATMLTTPITLDTGNAARVAEAGTISGLGTVAAGDLLEVVVDATVGTGTLPLGVFAEALIDEDPS